MLRLPRELLDETYSVLRACGRGRHECQVYWLASWSDPSLVSEVVHPRHRANLDGFAVEDEWLTHFWLRLARDNLGIAAQVHTHPHEAFHSRTDDEYPVVHTPGFLSLVIPDFALGDIGFARTYLTQIQPNGSWRELALNQGIALV